MQEETANNAPGFDESLNNRQPDQPAAELGKANENEGEANEYQNDFNPESPENKKAKEAELIKDKNVERLQQINLKLRNRIKDLNSIVERALEK